MKLDRARWKRRGLVALGILVAAGAFVAGRMSAPVHAPAAAAPDAAAATESEQWYTCSMHPQVRSRDPQGKCPICGMDLIPVPRDGDEGDDDGGLPRLRVSPRAAALMEIEVVPARRMHVRREIPLYGRVEADERRVKTITAWTAGRIERLHVDFTGQEIRAGEPMLELYSPPLIAAQEELLQALEARRRLSGTGGLGERTARDAASSARDKLRLLGVDAEFVEALVASGELRDRIAIPAPLDGVVTARHVSLGEWVETGRPLFDVADLSHLWVRLSVFETDLPWLRVGQEASIATRSHPGREFRGELSFVDPVLDERTRSVLVRIDVPNEEGLLKPGMFAHGVVRAELDAEPAREAAHARGEHAGPDEAPLPIVIPVSAPLITGRRAVVYVRLADADRPTFEPRDVALGPRAGDFYVVREGLDEGELVVVHGAFRIDSELQIRGRPSMMAPEGGAAPAHQHGGAGAREAPPPMGFAPGDVPDAFAAELTELFERYLDLSKALATDELHAAHAAASAMLARVRAADEAPLDDAQRKAWGRLAGDLEGALRAMGEAGDLGGAREHLPGLTEALSLALRGFAGDRAGAVYRAHCPMAFDFAGADWLQRGELIENPYFGAAMLRCGAAKVEIEGRAAERDGR